MGREVSEGRGMDSRRSERMLNVLELLKLKQR